MSTRRRGVAVLLLVVAVVTTGCTPKKAKRVAPSGSDSEVSESGLAPQGTLEQYRAGKQPGSGEGGPLDDVHFAFDSYDVDDSARGTLRSNADWLKDHSDSKVEVEGHCDERGTVEYNLALGAKRARAAKDYLVALGVSAERLTTISYGEELPICHSHDDSCWGQNRRAHFVTLGE